ncbi:hypothetical protein B0J12DRAFT_726951 [Macrophomina phaseolina]|uniref:Uncharacterized protein n=1 Tax=Macrophomina phaseolina TaxID=35725 RepID=A0ABQ8GKU9_9PEZI|nr:hypothetical protein B0J12DRAFT_726951 [Macrophomina phaseolina]
MSIQTKSLGDWVDGVIHEIFFQPDDELAVKAFDTYLAPDLHVRINLSHLTFDGYKEVVTNTRRTNIMSKQTNDEILKWEDEDGTSGVVGHHSKFTLKDKVTGKDTGNTFLILTAVKEVDGKRMITEITEIAT